MEPSLHPDVEPIAFLLGTWRGEGQGHYETIQPFAYGEEVRFWHVGKPFLAYTQRTWRTDDGSNAPAHAEMGYWRPKPEGRIEIALAHTFGIVEIQEGMIEGSRIDVASKLVGLSSTAKEVTHLERTFEVEGDVLRYQLRMAAVGRELNGHLEAELRRIE